MGYFGRATQRQREEAVGRVDVGRRRRRRDLLSRPQLKVGLLELSGHQGVELQRGPEASSDLRGKAERLGLVDAATTLASDTRLVASPHFRTALRLRLATWPDPGGPARPASGCHHATRSACGAPAAASPAPGCRSRSARGWRPGGAAARDRGRSTWRTAAAAGSRTETGRGCTPKKKHFRHGTLEIPWLTHNSPKYLEWNLASEKLGGFFSLKYDISRF